MSEEKNISYSATDIERYHKGLMTAKEMNALEKAALDDPFLADAIEGYSAVPVNAQADIALLNKNLDERTSERKVIPIKKSNFPWLRVAALFVILIGAGILTYRYAIVNKKSEVAAIKTDTAQRTSNKPDTTQQQSVPAESKSRELPSGKKDEPAKSDVASIPGKRKKITNSDTITQESGNANDLVASPTQSAPVTINSEEEKTKRQDDLSKESNAVAFKKSNAKLKIQQDADRIKDTATLQRRAAGVQYEFSQNNKTNIFRGQVLDANNSPLPFSNVTIIPDNIGTYSDAKGYFTLISPDSTLNVRVRSVGFENSTALLQNKLSNNAIVLQQDTKNIPSTVINSRQINTERKRQNNNMTLEEPEPADGWYNYDTYIANNIQIPDEIKTKTTSPGEVELSFDVNKEGEPVNIKVEKSACKECDEEAIRLLKDGPKWKKKKKNQRAKVAVSFKQEDH